MKSEILGQKVLILVYFTTKLGILPQKFQVSGQTVESFCKRGSLCPEAFKV